MGVVLYVLATCGLAFERVTELAGISADGVARNTRSTDIGIRSAHRQIYRPPDTRRCVMSVMIGIDPHKGSHAAAAVDTREMEVSTTTARKLLRNHRAGRG